MGKTCITKKNLKMMSLSSFQTQKEEKKGGNLGKIEENGGGFFWVLTIAMYERNWGKL